MNTTTKARRYNQLISEIDGVYHEISLKQGFSDSAMMILYTLSDNESSCLLTELIKQSGVSKQTINSALRKLENEGILFLESAGGKSKRVSLTEKGKAVAHETADKVMTIENKIYASWKPEEWETYMKLTERYLHELREEIKEI